MFCNAQDLAVHKSYTLSTPPNYQYSAAPSDVSSLTDGEYTLGKFWTQRSTVGWQLTGVTITIDLEKIRSIGSVTFNTVRSIEVGISFPKNIFIFLSTDNKKFMYVGDAADVPDNLPGNTKVKKFKLDNIDRSARFVKLVVVPEGHYLFCDEIEVLKSDKKAGRILRNNLIWEKDINNVVDSLKLPGHSSRNLVRLMDKIHTDNKPTSGSFQIVNNKQFLDLRSRITSSEVLGKNLLSLKNQLGKENASLLKAKFQLPYVIEKYNAWDTLDEFRIPSKNTNNLNFYFTLSTGKNQYGCFVLTNCNAFPQEFSFSIFNDNIVNKLELFDVPFVPSSYYSTIPDPLLPVNKAVLIDPGASEMFIFKITGITKGLSTQSITVSSSGMNSKIRITSRVIHEVNLDDNKKLNANVWAYFNSPMLKGHPKQAALDLAQHHINTMVVPPTILPNLESNNYASFISYLENLKDAENILLFMGYANQTRRNGYRQGRFLSPEWKQNFIKWYNSIVKLIHENCSPTAQIYLYPYDEMAVRNINDFKALIQWCKNAIPGVKFFATLNTQKGVDEMLNSVDIAQVLPSNYGIKIPKVHRPEIWIYTAITPARSLSPYAFYRLMAWDAFLNDYDGIGFWNYADERNGNKLNLISETSPNLSGNYSVIYNDSSGNILSSRRWEAFSLGIEDYSILQAYSEKFGVENTKRLVKDVVSQPANFNLADSVRNEMVTQLTK
jgi:hypothetical protein